MPRELNSDSDSHYEALTDGAGVSEMGRRTQIELTGADRGSFLHNLCTNDILELEPGRGCEAFLTNVQGKTLGYIFVFCSPDWLVLETAPGQADAIIAHLDHYLIREDVQLHDRTGQWGELLLSGNDSEKLVSRCIPVNLPELALGHVETSVDGTAVSVRRTPLANQPCFLISCAADVLGKVRERFEREGAVACGPEAVEVVRLETGSPLFGRDITDNNLPQEVARNELAISFTKGCYLGQETVARLDAVGHVNRALVGVRFEADQVPDPGTELTVNQKVVGRVTSAVFSPRLAAPLALAYVRREHYASGTRLSTIVGDATVITLPL